MTATRLFSIAPAIGLALALSAATATVAAETPVGPEDRSALTITVYNQDLALVSEVRRVDFAAGENALAILDVSRLLRPETVILNGEDLSLVEQGFDVDLMTARRLLDRALGQRVWVRRSDPDGGHERYLEGTLVSIAEQPLVRVGDRLEQVPHNDVVFEAGLGDATFRDRPTLFARLDSAEAGARDLGIAYLTGGLSWQADYVAQLNAEEDRLDIAALVTVGNNSGVDFENANLRFVAGQVNQVGGDAMLKGQMMRAEAMDSAAPMVAASPPMPAQAVGDQHLYSLERPISLANRQSKQVGLLDASGVAAIKEYRFENLINAYGGAQEIGPVKAQVVLEVENDAESGLGRALPEGVIRVYQAGPGGAGGAAPVFLGEDRIAHTSEGETLRLGIGSAFDVTGRSRQTAFERVSNKTYEMAQEITVENAKDQAIEAIVVGEMPQGWRMLEETLAHEEETASRLAWRLPVPAGGEASFSYRVRVTRP